jgi:hypothetical protein
MPGSGTHKIGLLPRRLALLLALVVVAWVPLAGPLSPKASAPAKRGTQFRTGDDDA